MNSPTVSISTSTPICIINLALFGVCHITKRSNGNTYFPKSACTKVSKRLWNSADDWQFLGWIAKEYGLEACPAKLDYMNEHRKRHSITNPRGFLRTALVKDFQPPAFIVAKLKADESAKRESERCRKESEEWRQMTADFSYESAAASLQKLLDSLD